MSYTRLKRIQTFVYPLTCLLCRAPGTDDLDLCTGCRASLPRIEKQCPQCALPMPAGTNGPCGRCQKQAPAFDAAAAAFAYESPVDGLVRQLKFQGQLVNARLLGRLLAEALAAREVERPDAIVPVPLHPRRVRERGFNQAQELAREVARRMGVPVARQAVRRVRATKPQMDLPAKERRKNVRGAFAVDGGLGVGHVALLDDVMTTGSTLNEIAMQLKRAGVERVQVWCVARAD